VKERAIFARHYGDFNEEINDFNWDFNNGNGKW
jgi:hypothetical protein